MKTTQKEKLLTIWVRKQSNDLTKFFYPYEFIGEGQDFIGYKAPARFSELCVAYPQLIESRMEGKYRIGRLRFDNALEFMKVLPRDLATVMETTMRENRVSYLHEVVQRRYDPTTNTMILEKKII